MIRSLNPRFAMACVAVAGLLFASLMVGEYNIFSPGGWEMMLITRIPRTIALVLSGAALAMSGLLMQLLTQNRFVEPTTTGTTEWAGLGLLISLIVFPDAGILQRMIMAVLCSFIGTMVFFAFLRKVSLKQSLVVPIIGIMLGAVIGALSTFLALEFDALQILAVWFQGSFTSVYQGQYEVLWLVLIVVIAVFWGADYFTAVGLGQDIATNLGVTYQRLVFFGTALIALATGVVTVVVGNLPFLGLIVPNIVSRFRGDNLHSNLGWVCLLGVGIVTASDLLARTIISPFEIPVSVVLGVIGAAFFVALIVRSSREH